MLLTPFAQEPLEACLIVASMLFALARFRFAPASLPTDLLLVALTLLWRRSEGLLQSSKFVSLERWGIIGLVVAVSAVAIFILVSSSRSTGNQADQIQENDAFVQNPVLLPSRTSHIRMIPTKHAFNYSYLLVGIPVGWKGSIGGFLSVDLQAQSADEQRNGQRRGAPREGWFSVEAEHYLTRGNLHAGLRGRLDAYLESEGISPLLYPHAFFVTAPKFLGYSFNPVSFWYLYDRDRDLSAMILEVNNTFDERRMYFCQRPEHEKSKDTSLKLKSSWPKDFHVSPFNPRDGDYSLIASDPLEPKMTGQPRINNVITLRSAEGQVKLVASIKSVQDPADPCKMSIWSMWRFVSLWWWVGLMTYPRIVKEAGKLFRLRNLGVLLWLRPEVKSQSLAREETPVESTLEPFFRRYLQHQAKHLGKPTRISYLTSLRYGLRSEVFMEGPTSDSGCAVDSIEVKILTPAFFSRFVHYAHTTEALTGEMICAREESKTISIDPLSRITDLFETSADEVSPNLPWQWEVLRLLRSPPPQPNYPLISKRKLSAEVRKSTDIRRFSYSGLDKFVATSMTEEESRIYRRVVIQEFLCQRLALGFEKLLGIYDLFVRAGLIWASLRIVALSLDMRGEKGGESNNGLGLTLMVGLVQPAIMLGVLHGWAMFKEIF